MYFIGSCRSRRKADYIITRIIYCSFQLICIKILGKILMCTILICDCQLCSCNMLQLQCGTIFRNHLIQNHCRINTLLLGFGCRFPLIVFIDLKFCIIQNLTVCFQVSFVNKNLIVPWLIRDVSLIGIRIYIIFTACYHSATIFYYFCVGFNGSHIFDIFTISFFRKIDRIQRLSIRIRGCRSSILVQLRNCIGVGTSHIIIILIINGTLCLFLCLGVYNLLGIINGFDFISGHFHRCSHVCYRNCFSIG